MTVRPRPTSDLSTRERERTPSGDERLLQLEAELEQERREHHAARQEINRLRRKVVEHAQAAERVRDTVSYRLGSAILRLRTWSGIAAYPFEILALIRESMRRRSEGRRMAALSARTTELMDDSLDDAADAVAEVKAMNLAPHDKAVVLMGLASARAAFDLPGAARLAGEAVSLDPTPRPMGRAAQLLFQAGQVQAPAEYARAALQGRLFDRRDSARLKVIAGYAQATAVEIPPRAAKPAFEPAPKRVAFLVSSALPHHQSGYTLRTQRVAKALMERGWDLRLATRPGYPRDRSEAREQRVRPGPYEVDGVRYTRLAGPSSSETPFPAYVEQSARRIERFIAEARPQIVYAASNHLTGLPSLIAARRAGLPFAYAVRGLWEYTAAAKSPGWELTERFKVQRDLETRVAEEADAVIVLSEGLRREMIARGVAAERIFLAPNCVDAAAFRPMPKDEKLAKRLGLKARYTLGFLGSLEHYEGLDDLLEGVSLLIKEGLDLAVLIVGEGSASGHLREETRRLDLGDRVVQLGRVPPDQVAAHYSVVDAAVFPRRPLPVCEIVTPLKPLEAMAMAKPVIASDVAALAELCQDGETGLLFRKGDVRALADAIRRLVRDPGLGLRLGVNARAWVEAHRTWDTAAAAVEQALTAAVERHS